MIKNKSRDDIILSGNLLNPCQLSRTAVKNTPPKTKNFLHQTTSTPVILPEFTCNNTCNNTCSQSDRKMTDKAVTIVLRF